MFLLPALYVWIVFALRGGRPQELVTEAQHASWRAPFLALITVVGYYSVLKAYQVMELSVVIPIVYTSTMLVAFGGVLFLKERENLLQKCIGVVLVFAGAVILQL